MKKSLAHLPKHKKSELKAITDTIQKTVDDLVMIILYGSYARGTWVCLKSAPPGQFEFRS